MNPPGKRVVLGAAAACLLLAATACTAAAPTKTEAQVAQGVAESSPRRGPQADFVPRAQFTERNFGAVTVSDLARLGLDVELPATAAGGTLQGIYVPDANSGDPTAGFMAVYSNDLVIEVTRFPSETDARDQALLYGVDRATFGDYVTEHSVKSGTAYARPMIDVAAELDAAGAVAPGTGLHTSAATVVWTTGRYTIQLLSRGAGIEDLLVVANGVSVQAAGARTP